jgi:hypothetical protein
VQRSASTLVEAEAQRDRRHQPVAERGERRRILEHARAKSFGLRREEVGPVQRSPGDHERVVNRQLLAEVDAFLQVGPAGRQLVADTEVAAPRAAGERHADPALLLDRFHEELAAQRLELRLHASSTP